MIPFFVTYAVFVLVSGPILERIVSQNTKGDEGVFLWYFGAILWPVTGLIALGFWLRSKAK